MGFVGRGKYRGRGGYWGRAFGNMFGLGDLGDKLGDAASGAISTFVPGGAAAMNLIGSKHGQALGKLASQYTGQGRYRGRGAYSDNSLIAGDTLVAPRFTAEPDGASVTISHREYVKDIYGPGVQGGPAIAFDTQHLDINPGLESCFPWLSQIAANYEEYEMKQLIFTYRSVVSDFNSGTGQTGQVLMATQYNSNKDPFYEKVTMMQYDGAMSGKASHDQLHGVECDPGKLSGSAGKYVRVAPVLENQDKNDYDAGQFNIAVADSPVGFNGQAIGELWVSYTVHLRKPKFFTGRGYAISRDVFWTRAGIANRPFLNPLATNTLQGQQNNIGCKFDRVSSTLRFPNNYSGNIKIRITLAQNYGGPAPGPSVPNVNTVCTAVLGGNVVLIQDIPYANLTAAPLPAPVGEVIWTAITMSNQVVPGSPSQVFNYEAHLRVTVATNGGQNTIQFQWGALPTTQWTSSFLDVSEYNVGLNYRVDGQNDELKLVDPSGQVVNV